MIKTQSLTPVPSAALVGWGGWWQVSEQGIWEAAFLETYLKHISENVSTKCEQTMKKFTTARGQSMNKGTEPRYFIDSTFSRIIEL